MGGPRPGGGPRARPAGSWQQLCGVPQHRRLAVGDACHRRPVRAGGGGPRQGGRAAHFRQVGGRPLQRTRLRACAGSPLADGDAAPHWPGTPVGDLRRAHLPYGCVPAHARSVRPCRALTEAAATGGAEDARGLCARRQRLHQSPGRLARAAPAARIPAAAPSAGAVAGGRQRGRHQDDGAAALNQHQPGDDAPDLCGAGPGSRRHRGPDAARRGGSPAGPADRLGALSPVSARHAAQAGGAGGRRSDRIGRVQQLGGGRLAHEVGQAAARQRSASAADRTVDLVSGASGARQAGRPRSISQAPASPACR